MTVINSSFTFGLADFKVNIWAIRLLLYCLFTWFIKQTLLLWKTLQQFLFSINLRLNIIVAGTDCIFFHRQTPLHLAVQNNHEGVVLAIIEHKKLVEKGDMPATDRSNVSLLPNLNLKNSEGDTPASLALSEGEKETNKLNLYTLEAVYVIFS